MEKKLSQKQTRILGFIRDFLDDHQFPPTVRDIQAGCQISSTSVVDYNLRILQREGYLRRFAEVFLAPLGGWLGDRYGADRLLLLSTVCLAGGFAALSMDVVYLGAVAVIVARAVIAAVGPAEVAHRNTEERTLHRIAVMQSWRDFGAAVGPLMAGFLLDQIALSWLNGGIAIVVLLGLFLQRRP